MTDRRVYDDPTGLVPLNADPGDTDPLYLDGSYGDVALAPTLAGDGFVLVSGASSVTLAPVIAADGWVEVDGTGVITLALALTGAGTVSGDVAPPDLAPAGGGMGRRVQQLRGSGAITLGLVLTGRGTVNDDDLVLLLAA